MDKIANIIKRADAVVITAGAGMGVDSGLPDFRGDEGFWRAYPLIKKLGISFAQMANPRWFEKDPKFAWAFYGHRLNLYRETSPHQGLKYLLNFVKAKNENYFIFTSNVDGQFQKAGFDPNKIVEIHGSIHYLQCSKNCKNEILSAEDLKIEVDMKQFRAMNIPYCKRCGSVLRPNILMFGDWEWNADRTNMQIDLYVKWLREVEKREQNLIVIEVGAGTAVPTVRNESNRLVITFKNATLFRINPREYELDNNLGFSLPCGGLEGIKRLFA